MYSTSIFSRKENNTFSLLSRERNKERLYVCVLGGGGGKEMSAFFLINSKELESKYCRLYHLLLDLKKSDLDDVTIVY